MAEKSYTLAECARALNRKVRTMRVWVHSGKLAATKDERSGRWKVTEDELRRLTNGNEN